MDSARLSPVGEATGLIACSHCQATGCPWDRIGPCPVCPDCQEALVLGESGPLVQRLVERPCAVCAKVGSVPFVTYPLHMRQALELDLCPRHFHALMSRRLDRYAYRSVVRALKHVGLEARQVFLLHEAFYDERGHPLHPVREL